MRRELAADISFDEVRANGWVAVGDPVLDLGPMSKRHKGGSAAIEALAGQDGTLQLINAHGVQGQTPKLPRPFVVGTLDESTLPPLERDLRALLADFRARGLFRYKRSWLAFDVGFAVSAAAIGLALVVAGHPMIGALVLAASQLHAMWWVHDACHNAMFATEKTARRWGEVASVVFVGMPVLRYQYAIHRIHHGLTNVIGGDQALETGPIVWDERMRARTNPILVALQPLLWLAIVLPLTFPFFLWASVVDAVRRRAWLPLAYTAARWILIGVALGPSAMGWTLLSVCIAAFFMGLFSSLNHFHRSKSAAPGGSLARSVSRATQNLHYQGRFATWLFGGLNLHVEHHLFATMPRQNYPVIAKEVRALFARHRLEYAECGLGESLATLYATLRDPFGEDSDDRGLSPVTASHF